MFSWHSPLRELFFFQLCFFSVVCWFLANTTSPFFFSLCAKGWTSLGVLAFSCPAHAAFSSFSLHQQNRLWRTKGEGARSTPLSLLLSHSHSPSLTITSTCSLSPYLSISHLFITVVLPLCCNSLMPHHLPLPTLSIKTCRKQ